MNNLLIPLALIFCSLQLVSAQSTIIYKQIPSENITVTASSAISSSPALHLSDNSGMKGDKHISNNLGEGMWVSEISNKIIRYSPKTKEGIVWILCEFKNPEIKIDQIRIWNHNQNEHTRRGLNNAYFEYSEDGQNWFTINNHGSEIHSIPESKGHNLEAADYILNIPGTKMKYLCITALSGGLGNHYDRNNPIIMKEMYDMNQNPNYYGLSEIRFYKKTAVNTALLPTINKMEFKSSQGYLKTSEGPSREFSVIFDKPIYCGGTISFENNGRHWSSTIEKSGEGITKYNGLFPAGYMEETSEIKISLKSKQADISETFDVPAARKWTVCFFPHSHLDIGYTHHQDDVMKLQWRNLERALDLADRTETYPKGSIYKWNSEATWPVMGYLEHYAGTEKADRLIRAIQKGTINIDASLGSILTGISRQEELNHYFDDAHKIEKLTGVRLNTAMMSDVPGQVWGTATAMAQNGIDFFSPGPNYVPFYGKIGNDRAAAIHIKWGDRPFFWESQSGTDKVLVWSAGRGYSSFHGWLAGRLSVCGLDPIWEYLTELERDEFPYRMCYLRYTVHGDNGPPDELMPDIIKEWNEKYDSPHFEISTSKDFFEAFISEYKDNIPTYRGDMTPTWEDGAASTARETAMNRESASRMSRSGILWSMLTPDKHFPFSQAEKAWKNIVLFSEHTWGAAGSGSDPFSTFTKELWLKKKSYADSADYQSKQIEKKAISKLSGLGKYIHILNTNLWKRTDVVFTETELQNRTLKTKDGISVPIQKMSNGKWCFLAKDISPLSSSVLYIKNKTESYKYELMAKGNVIDNGIIRVIIDEKTGTITSLTVHDDTFNYASEGLNNYLYTERVGKNPQTIKQIDSIKIIDNGPVAATIRIWSSAPGCNYLTRDITLYREIKRVDITNTIDKKEILDFENVRFVFPFNFPHPEITIDLAMSEMHPEREQLSGVNKNYYCMLNGISVGDLEHGICLISKEAPFVELGSPSGEDYRKNPNYGYGWWMSSQISPKIYSWVMTNTWRTNYKASQGGKNVFHYSLIPEDPHNLNLKKHGFEREQELISVNSKQHTPIPQLFRLTGKNRIAISGMTPAKDGSGYIVRLQNQSGEPVHTSFVWGSIKGRSVSTCDWKEESIKEIDPSSFWMKPFEYKVLKIKTNIKNNENEIVQNQ